MLRLLNVGRVAPKILVFFIVGTGVLSIIISSGIFTSFVLSVKRVAEDLPDDTFRCWSVSQLLTVWRYSLRCWLSCGMSLPVQYSEYDIISISGSSSFYVVG